MCILTILHTPMFGEGLQHALRGEYFGQYICLWDLYDYEAGQLAARHLLWKQQNGWLI